MVRDKSITTQREAIDLMPPQGVHLFYGRGYMWMLINGRHVDLRVWERLLDKGTWETVETTRNHTGVMVRATKNV